MIERTPVNKYSKDSYQEGLDRLSEKEGEARAKAQPFLEELAVHEELRKEGAGPYEFATEEAALRVAYEKETKEVHEEVERIRQKLHRLFENAHSEALTMDEQMKSKRELQRILPKIEEMEKAASLALGISLDGAEEDTFPKPPTSQKELSRLARAYGWTVLQTAESAKGTITGNKPIPSSRFIREKFDDLQQVYKEFKESLTGNPLGQNKYGHAM